MIKLENVIFSYGEDDLKFNCYINKGESIALIGASGAGKSTFLNLIAGFFKPASGRIFIDDKDVTNDPPHSRSITIMFQEHNLFPHFNVKQNIAIGMKTNFKLSEKEIFELEEMIDNLGLKGLEARYPAELSGGQRQRVALARCVLRKKSILLLDEPFTGLDPFFRKEMLELLNSLREKHNLTIVMATHYLEDAFKLCSKAAFLFNNTIHQFGDIIEIFKEKNDPALKRFLGDT